MAIERGDHRRSQRTGVWTKAGTKAGTKAMIAALVVGTASPAYREFQLQRAYKEPGRVAQRTAF